MQTVTSRKTDTRAKVRAFCLVLLVTCVPKVTFAQRIAAPAGHIAIVDSAGVIRWKDTGREVALFGANYALPSASDYRAAGYLGADRKKLVDEDMAQWARMGWDALRISFWGDWENTDHAGNLIANDHLDLMDYLIARARERGIYVLLSPITTYQSTWPDATSDTTPPGFANFYRKSELGTNPAAIAAQVNYIQQLLRHLNPYTGLALEDDPSIIFVEMINEPTHHSADVAGSIAYINTLVDAVRSTRSTAITFHNLSQDFAMAEPIAKSKVQGITFGWYPTGLNSGHELRGNYLRTVDSYDPMRDPRVAKLPRIVYEFDSPDLRTGYMYPAMVRTMRSVGAQFAAMFAYDMLATSSRNLGWQTHYLNLVYTPRKAMSAIIAAEAMRRLPRGKSYGAYPANKDFGDFHVSDDDNSGVLTASDAYLNAGATRIPAPDAARLSRVAGYQSSPIVSYGGEGIYFLDRIRTGMWRLEVYPDAVPVRDPFELPRADKIVTRAIARRWPMTISLPDLGGSFTVRRLAGVASASDSRQAADGRIEVTPGVYLLGKSGDIDPTTLPATIGEIGLTEYHAPPTDTMPLTVVHDPPGEFVLGSEATLSARVVDTVAPDSVVLSLRRRDQLFFGRWQMHPSGAYDYSVSLPIDSIGAGPVDYVITVISRGVATTFPDDRHARPSDWNFDARELWHASVVAPATPVTLFRAGDDAQRLAFSRIGDGWREGIYRVLTSTADGAPIFHFELPRINGRGPSDYTASLVVRDRIVARGPNVRQASGVRVRLRAARAGDIVHLTLVEPDGAAFSAAVRADTAWSQRTIPLAAFRPSRSVKLPEGFPGEWNYWLDAPSGRGGNGDRIRPEKMERLQLSLRPGSDVPPKVEIDWVTLVFR
jgi:hypothetical protein